MSRSFKRFPTNSVISSTKKLKRRSSKRVRRMVELADGGNYKKAFDSFFVKDYSYRPDEDERVKK